MRNFYIFEALWKLIRGDGRARFASLLVRSGVGLMLGPPLFEIIAIKFFNLSAGAKDSLVDEIVALASFICGLGLSITGVVFFVRHRPLLADCFGIKLDGGERFHDMVYLAADMESKAVTFLGFDKAELRRPLRSHTFQGTNYLELIEALGALATGDDPFPPYSVQEQGPNIIVRKTS